MNWELECNANLAKREQAMADARAVMMQGTVNVDLLCLLMMADTHHYS